MVSVRWTLLPEIVDDPVVYDANEELADDDDDEDEEDDAELRNPGTESLSGTESKWDSDLLLPTEGFDVAMFRS